MRKILNLNGAQPYPFAKGALNATLAGRAREYPTKLGHEVRTTVISEGYDVESEVANHQWADTVIIQFPVNWTGVPWSFKMYIDEGYTAGMDGRLCVGDGRTAARIGDLRHPMHLNAKFFGMSPLPTFAAFDVRKNPEIDADLPRFDTHLKTVFRG